MTSQSHRIPRITARTFLITIMTASTLHAEDAEALFTRRIRPLFQEKCLACHGNDEGKIKGGLDMRTLASTLKGGDSEQPAIVAGEPEKSPLYLAALRNHDDWEPMPPKEADKLYAEQVAWIKDWIAGGAAWPDEARAKEILNANAEKWSAEDGLVVKTSGGLSDDWTNRRYKPEGLWAYQPVKKPATKRSGAAAIDELLANRMPEGLAPAPAADARTFIRRATFDLTGPGAPRVACGGRRRQGQGHARSKDQEERQGESRLI